MRSNLWILLGCALPLAACSHDPAGGSAGRGPAGDLPPLEAPGGECRREPLQAFLGKTASKDVLDEALRASGAVRARVVKPGMAVTMDFRPDRITVAVDDNNRIERINCG